MTTRIDIKFRLNRPAEKAVLDYIDSVAATGERHEVMRDLIALGMAELEKAVGSIDASKDNGMALFDASQALFTRCDYQVQGHKIALAFKQAQSALRSDAPVAVTSAPVAPTAPEKAAEPVVMDADDAQPPASAKAGRWGGFKGLTGLDG